MICTTIQHKTYEEILSILDDPFVEMAEIRLDLNNLTDEEIQDLFGGSEKPLVATYRVPPQPDIKAFNQQWEKALRKMSQAVEAGARYVDVDLTAPVNISKYFQKLCHKTGTELIRSYHDFEKTPDLEYLEQVKQRCFRYGADVAKIVTTATENKDCDEILSLYSPQESQRLVAFAMGREGQKTRIDCLRKGAPFTYAAWDEPAADGQIPVTEMHEKVYGDFLGLYRADFRIPASKSFAQRAIIAAALAEGTSHLTNYTPCDDSESAVKVARSLGAKVARKGSTLTIEGLGPIKNKLELERINAGESGILARLMIPILAQVARCPVSIEGRGTLLRRPLAAASDIMAAFGVILRNEEGREGREIHVPLTVKGELIAGTADLPGKPGSQLVSGVLMALPLNPKDSKVYVGEPKSIPYMFITLDVLRKFGIKAGAQLEGNAEMLEQQDWSYCTGINFTVPGGQSYKAADLTLEGDWSAAANFLVGGALFGSVELRGLDTSSLQADISILDVLVEAGASVAYDEDTVCVKKGPLEAFDFDLSQAPDIFPIVSLLAAFCAGTSTIAGVGRLKGKESDRAAAIVEMLTKMGVRAWIEGDILSVEGETLASRLLNGRLLKGGDYSAHSDHRMAMVLRIASMAADSPIVIDDPACVAKSFPEFFEQF
ncbi:MAG: 3-phosphoshikimate 1-carboxyvinyltransferase [Bacteroidales bacterium]|nr:3-phosphoshikimate 1-carboxyvinyltransferase [Bacteroidales bacterium]